MKKFVLVAIAVLLIGYAGLYLYTRPMLRAGGAQAIARLPVGAPPLAIAKAYSRDQFSRLLHTGITLAGTESKSGLMTGMARNRFFVLTEAESRELHGFLTGKTSSRRPPPPTIVRTANAEIGAAEEMMTPEELDAWKRKNAESMKILEHVPELEH